MTTKTNASKQDTVARVNAAIGLQNALGGETDFDDIENDSDFDLLDLMEAGADLSNPWDVAEKQNKLPRHDPNLEMEGVLAEEADARAATPEITEDDWDPEIFPIVNVLKRMVRQAVNVNTKPVPREKALRWIFQSDLPGPHGLDFKSACLVLGARPYVVQARAQHQLWISNIPLRRALPDGADTLPHAISTEIRARLGSEALFAARTIWDWPGIRADVLQDVIWNYYLERKSIDRVMLNLEQNGYVACAAGFWYFISRNFETMTTTYRRRFSWGPSFFGEE